MVLSASLRSLIPATVLLAVGFAIGVEWPGLAGLVLALLLVMGMGDGRRLLGRRCSRFVQHPERRRR